MIKAALASATLLAHTVIPGDAPDLKKDAVGGISSMRYDPGTQELYALPDRGPGDGTVAYHPRYYRYRVLSFSPELKLRMEKVELFRDDRGRPFSGLIQSEFGRIDPEGLVLGHGGGLYVSEEYGPYIYHFDSSGRFLDRFSPPEHFLPDGARGRATNRGFEGLCLTPSRKRLVAVLQSPLMQDGGKKGRRGRLLIYDFPPRRTTLPEEFTFRMVDASKFSDQGLKQNHIGVNEILAIDEDSFLILERDNRGFKGDPEKNTVPVYKRLVRLDLQKDGTALRTPILDLVAVLKKGGVDPKTVAPKFESIEWGPKIDGKETLWVSVDNDFRSKVPTHIFLIQLSTNIRDSRGLPGYKSE